MIILLAGDTGVKDQQAGAIYDGSADREVPRAVNPAIRVLVSSRLSSELSAMCTVQLPAMAPFPTYSPLISMK
jgi:hypothetical protein